MANKRENRPAFRQPYAHKLMLLVIAYHWHFEMAETGSLIIVCFTGLLIAASGNLVQTNLRRGASKSDVILST